MKMTFYEFSIIYPLKPLSSYRDWCINEPDSGQPTTEPFNFAPFLIRLAVMVPLVSVIIPTYNRADLVRQAVASVKAQTYRDFEIVVVDDGGTDGTCEVLSAGREIRVLRHPGRRGVAAARNTGIGRGPGGVAGLSGFRRPVAAGQAGPANCLV